MPIVVGGIPTPIPFAPSLVSPSNAAYVDMTTQPTFEWTFASGVGTSVQSAWAFRRKVAGATAYQFWSVSTSAWQSTIVWNSGTVQDYTFPLAAWVNGQVWNWSVATQDINGTGPFAADATLTAQAGPTVTVVSPGGTVTTAQPEIIWSISVPAGSTMTSYRVIILNATQYGDGRATPDVGANVYDSGTVGSAYGGSLIVPVPLPDFTTYRAYVMITETGGQASSWAYSAFTTSYAQPATPLLAAVPSVDASTGAPTTTLTIQGQDNLLSAADALTLPGTGGIGTWTVVSAQTGTATESGGLLQLALASGQTEISAQTALYPVVPGAGYAFACTAAVTAGGTSGTFETYIQWFDAGRNIIGGNQPTTGATSLGSPAENNCIAPANAAYALLGISAVPGSSGKVLVSDAALGPATGGLGKFGGFAGLGTASVTYSDDGGFSWWPLRNGAGLRLPLPAQTASVIDHEAPPGFTRHYQAVVAANDAISSGAFMSTNSTPALQWWLKDPLNPTANMVVHLQPGTLDTTSTDRQQEYQVLGRPDPVILSDAFELPQLQLTLLFITDAEYQAFEALRATQHTFLLQGPAPAGQWYIRMGATKQDSTNLPSLRGYAGTGNVVRTVQLTAQTVAAP